jgi:hypothetical protein
LFEATEFPDEDFRLYVYDRPYTTKGIILALTKALFHDNPDVIDIEVERREKMNKKFADSPITILMART